MRKVKMFIGELIWDFCEKHNIDLGKYTPDIFGMMIGCSNYKVIEIEKENE